MGNDTEVGAVFVKYPGEDADESPVWRLECGRCGWAETSDYEDSALTIARMHATTHERQDAYLSGLRAMTSFLEDNPLLIHSHMNLNVSEHFYDHNVYDEATDSYVTKEGTARAEMVARARQIGGRWEKETDSYYFRLVKAFGPHRIVLAASRESVCERIVVGTHTEKERKAVRWVEEDRLVEDVEWKCPESLLAAADDQVQS